MKQCAKSENLPILTPMSELKNLCIFCVFFSLFFQFFSFSPLFFNSFPLFVGFFSIF